MKKKIIIIGGGVSGLSAGIYALKYGFDAVIIEKNPVLGGLCTGWNRKGFYIDGCTHWLNGTLKATSLYKDWNYLDVVRDEKDYVNLDCWYSMEVNGKIISLYSSVDKTERELIQNFPVDTKVIKKLMKMTRNITRFNLPVEYPMGHIPLSRIFKLIREFIRFSPTLIYSMLVDKNKFINKKIKSPELKYALINVQNLKENLYTLLYSYSCVSSGNGGAPLGGSIELIKRMRNKFETMGGSIYTNSEVSNIIIKDNKIDSIKLKTGIDFEGDYYISAVEPDYLFSNLLDKKFTPRGFLKRSKKQYKYIAPSCVLVYFVIKDMPDINVSRSFKCREYTIGENRFDNIHLRSYTYDPIYTHDNKVLVQVLIEQTNLDFEYWSNLHNDEVEYQNEKKEIAKIIKDRIIEKYPNLKDNIELLDVVTPMTFKRYVNASKGCYMSYTYANDGPLFYHKGRVKNISNLYLASQWVISPGGLPLAMTCGKFAAMKIAKKEKVNIYR